MALRLAAKPIVLRHGNASVVLRPSLRAGFRIAQRYTLAELRKGIDEFDFTMICHLAAIGADDPVKAVDFLAKHLADRGAIPRLQAHTPAFVEFVAQSLGLSGDAQTTDEIEADTSTTAPKEPDLVEELTGLFKIGTGWLGWTPRDVWQATPAEIINAHDGLITKLKAIHGSSEEPAPTDPRTVPTEAQVKANVADLKAKFGKVF